MVWLLKECKSLEALHEIEWNNLNEMKLNGGEGEWKGGEYDAFLIFISTDGNDNWLQKSFTSFQSTKQSVSQSVSERDRQRDRQTKRDWLTDW